MALYGPLPSGFYSRPTRQVARDLLGRYLVRELAGEKLVVRIVETEAYLGKRDRASHAWQGRRTARNKSLYEAAGTAYVYFIYGMYYCLNAVSGETREGGAVLIRAGEPVVGTESMLPLRSLERCPRPGDLAGGPGKLCQALAIDKRFDGASLIRGALRITRGEPPAAEAIATGRRVGIDYAGQAVQWPLRFAVLGNRHVSRPYPWK